jgi:hypothetical protein
MIPVLLSTACFAIHGDAGSEGGGPWDCLPTKKANLHLLHACVWCQDNGLMVADACYSDRQPSTISAASTLFVPDELSAVVNT